MRSHHLLARCRQFAGGVCDAKRAIWIRYITGDVFDDPPKTFGGRIDTISCLPDFLEKFKPYLRLSS